MILHLSYVLRTLDEEVLTPGQEILTSGKEVLIPGQEVPTLGQEVLTSGQEVMTPGQEVLTPGQKVLSVDSDMSVPVVVMPCVSAVAAGVASELHVTAPDEAPIATSAVESVVSAIGFAAKESAYHVMTLNETQPLTNQKGAEIGIDSTNLVMCFPQLDWLTFAHSSGCLLTSQSLKRKSRRQLLFPTLEATSFYQAVKLGHTIYYN